MLKMSSIGRNARVQTFAKVVDSLNDVPKKPHSRTKHEVDRMIRCGDMAIRSAVPDNPTLEQWGYRGRRS